MFVACKNPVFQLHALKFKKRAGNTIKIIQKQCYDCNEIL
jgi:hypothetical protein